MFARRRRGRTRTTRRDNLAGNSNCSASLPRAVLGSRWRYDALDAVLERRSLLPNLSQRQHYYLTRLMVEQCASWCFLNSGNTLRTVGDARHSAGSGLIQSTGSLPFPVDGGTPIRAEKVPPPPELSTVFSNTIRHGGEAIQERRDLWSRAQVRHPAAVRRGKPGSGELPRLPKRGKVIRTPSPEACRGRLAECDEPTGEIRIDEGGG